MDLEVFIGWDRTLRLAWQVSARSLLLSAASAGSAPPAIQPIGMQTLRAIGLYNRPTVTDARGRLVDVLSDAPMATEFALARFFVPFVTKARWALFCDGDFLFRGDVHELLRQAIAGGADRHAVMVVKHEHWPNERLKMEGELQTSYERKNWSSLVLWNMAHAGVRRLSIHDANTQPGLWLHQFRWLFDQEIGELPIGWNWLEGSQLNHVAPESIRGVHFTRGTPDMPGYANAAFAEEWRGHLIHDELVDLEAPCRQESSATA